MALTAQLGLRDLKDLSHLHLWDHWVHLDLTAHLVHSDLRVLCYPFLLVPKAH